MKISPELNKFSNGVLTPRLYGRTDSDNYWSGLKTGTNAVCLPHGPVTKRAGSKFIASAHNSNYPVEVYPFSYGDGDNYILEFGHEYMRVFREGQIVLDGVGQPPYVLTTPFSAVEVVAFDITQSADTMFIASADRMPQVLERTDHNDWSIESLAPKWGPFLNTNTNISATITATTVTGSITLTASVSGTFNADHVGAQWLMTDIISEEALISTDNSFTANVYVKNPDEVLVATATNGTWGDTKAYVRKSYDGGTTWHFASTAFASNGSIQIVETIGDAYYHIGVPVGQYDTGTVSGTIQLLNQRGYVEITSFNSTTSVGATVIEELPSTNATYKWAEGAWSDHRGYPRTVTLFEDRLTFGGNEHRPLTVWLSKTDDFNNFDEGVTVLATNAIKDSFLSVDVNSIRWMESADVLRIGTSGDEWRYGFKTEATTPDNRLARKQSTAGSNYCKPVNIDNIIVFIQTQGQKLMSQTYSDTSETYIPVEISTKAEHLIKDSTGITGMTHVRNPDPLLYMIKYGAGDIVVSTLDLPNAKSAFCSWETQGYYESTASIEGLTRDEVWVVVARQNDSGWFRSIEQFQPYEFDDANTEAFLLDSYLVYDDGIPTTTLSGMDHLEGQVVYTVASGYALPPVTVSGGIIELQTEVSYAYSGLQYDWEIETMNLNFNLQGTSTKGKSKRAHQTAVEFKDTNYCNMGPGTTAKPDGDPVIFRTPEDNMGEAIPVFNGTKKLVYPKGYSDDYSLRFTSNLPLPCTILSIAPVMSVETGG